MVLSNKKLKQKLREALAKSLTAKEESKPQEPKPQSKSFKELLGSSTQKPRLSKREKRRKILPFQGTQSVEQSNGDGGDAQKEALNGEKKKKKRKREEGGGSGVVESIEEKPTVNGGDGEEKKKKKRKREEGGEKEGGGGVAELAEEKPVKKRESKEKKKKMKEKMKEKKKKMREKKKEKKVKKEVKEEEIVEPENAEVKVETVEVNESQENADVATKVYVGGIPYYSTEEDIQSFFEGCGTITELDCMTFPETGKFRGIAMITFKTEAAAKRALALDGADMGGLFLKIQPYKINRTQKSSDFAPKIVQGYNRVYVGNLSWDITEEDLKNLFSDCKISSIRFGEDKTTGEFKGYAHVDFSDSLSLTIALKLDQKVVCGRPVKIMCAVTKKKAENQSNSASKISKAENNSGSKSNQAENSSVSLSGEKKKRRTCYECGVAGHISSACPNKKTVDAAKSSQEWSYKKIF